jgi:hypothetical protein
MIRALILSMVLAVPVHADHVTAIDIMLGQEPLPTLQDVDACILGPSGLRSVPEMTETCRPMFESCFSKLHIELVPLGMDHVQNGGLLHQCANNRSGQYYQLSGRHELEVAAAFPRESGEGRRADALSEFVGAPKAEAAERLANCIQVYAMSEAAMAFCSEQWRRDELFFARFAWSKHEEQE